MTLISKLKKKNILQTMSSVGSFEILHSPVNVILQICHFFPLSLHGTLESNKHLYQVLKYFQFYLSQLKTMGFQFHNAGASWLIYFPLLLFFILQNNFCNGMINLTPWPCKRTFFYIFYNDLEIVRNFSSRLIVRRSFTSRPQPEL